MRFHFYGTKGHVEERSRAHTGHSAFTIETNGFRLLCDFGKNRKGLLSRIRPDAIFLSHAHPDHAWGLEEGTAVPVLASAVTHEITGSLPIGRRVVLEPGRAVSAGPYRLTAHPVVHSIRCPCVAARIASEEGVVVYSGDIVAFERPEEALRGADLYLGDGSTLTGSLVRRHPTGVLIGHTSVRAQLGWLEKHRIPRAVFSHFGKGLLRHGRPRRTGARTSVRLSAAARTVTRDSKAALT